MIVAAAEFHSPFLRHPILCVAYCFTQHSLFLSRRMSVALKYILSFRVKSDKMKRDELFVPFFDFGTKKSICLPGRKPVLNIALGILKRSDSYEQLNSCNKTPAPSAGRVYCRIARCLGKSMAYKLWPQTPTTRSRVKAVHGR